MSRGIVKQLCQDLDSFSISPAFLIVAEPLRLKPCHTPHCIYGESNHGGLISRPALGLQTTEGWMSLSLGLLFAFSGQAGPTKSE